MLLCTKLQKPTQAYAIFTINVSFSILGANVFVSVMSVNMCMCECSLVHVSV